MLKDPKYKELVESPAWQEHWRQLQEDYRTWLLTRKIKASYTPDVSTEEGRSFLSGLQKTIDFVREHVKPIPVDPLEPFGEQYRRVAVTLLFDTIEITIKSQPRRGKKL